MAIEAVLIDMDGVLVDSESLAAEVLREVLQRRGISISKEESEKYVWGRVLSESFSELAKDYNLDAEALLKEHRAKYNSRLPDVEPLPGAYDAVKSCKERYGKIALVSGATREQIGIVLNKLKIKGYFDEIIGYENIHEGKPSPNSYLAGAERLKADITRCVVLEDAAVGIEAANRAGAFSIGIKAGSRGKQDLSKAKYVAETLQDIDWQYVSSVLS